MPRVKGTKNISPVGPRVSRPARYVVSDKTDADLASEFGLAEQTIRYHRATSKAEIGACERQWLVTECDRVWGAKLRDHVANKTHTCLLLGQRLRLFLSLWTYPDWMNAPAEPVGRLSRVVPRRSAASPPASVRLHHRRRQPAPRRSHAGPS